MDDSDPVVLVVRKWKSRDGVQVPEWWEWAVAAAQYHLADCDWVRIGVSNQHCSCALTRVIAKIIEDAQHAPRTE